MDGTTSRPVPFQLPPGAKGLGLFLAPRYDSKGRSNFDVRRLKEKSATVSVPPKLREGAP
jgi:hypothetical protein